MYKDDGFALPSVLFLVTILTLVALSVLLLDYLDRQIALRTVARVKAEYAAQSGVARLLEELSTSGGSIEPFTPRRYRFEDGSEAFVCVQPWGIYQMVESEGSCRGLFRRRYACVAARPPEAFQQALVLGTTQHQLVFTGTSHITGDISIGQGGATTGSLYGYPTPVSLPLNGHVTNGGTSKGMPQVDREALHAVRQYYENLLVHKPPPEAKVAALASGEPICSVADSVDIVYASGRLNFQRDSLLCRTRPLVIVASGSVLCFHGGAKMVGPLTIVSEDSVFIGCSVTLDHLVLYSQRAIKVEAAHLASSQLLGPRISFDSTTSATYPSALISITPAGSSLTRQSICLKAGSSVEGFIYLDSPFRDDVVTVESGAHVTGAVYSSSRVTLDGTVEGSVLAGDLFFYEAPTTYLGWIRSGTIDRAALPDGFLIPPLFLGKHSSGILEWL
jgi:hypothetical protein